MLFLKFTQTDAKLDISFVFEKEPFSTFSLKTFPFHGFLFAYRFHLDGCLLKNVCSCGGVRDSHLTLEQKLLVCFWDLMVMLAAA